MKFQRTRTVTRLETLTKEEDYTMIVVTGKGGVGKKTLLRLFHETHDTQSVMVEYHDGDDLETLLGGVTLSPEHTFLIILNESSEFIIGMLRQWREKQKNTSLTLLTHSEELYDMEDEMIVSFPLSGISWREYRDGLELSIPPEVYSSEPETREKIQKAYEEYLLRGSYPDILAEDDAHTVFSHQKTRFESQCAFMVSQLYKKDEILFQNFLKTLALETGSLLKADALSKLTGIPRRKISQFLDVLVDHGVIDRLSPFVQDPTIETSIHDRFYWSDLSFMRVLLGDMYMQGGIRQKVIENFLYLELKNTLSDDHLLWFYRKKSQATLPFLLERISNQELIPITFTDRNSQAISQVIQSFQKTYGNLVKRYMVFTNTLVAHDIIDTKEILFLPCTIM